MAINLERLDEKVCRHERNRLSATDIDPVEWEVRDWFADSCSCGLPAGKCCLHHRARANQRPPDTDWRTLMWLAGRAFGKTRVGAEWVRWMAESGRARRIALVAPTAADARHVMVEGESGLMSVCPSWDRPIYNPSNRQIRWRNGAVATTYSAEEPNRLRGPQHDAAWADELCAWQAPQTWDMLMFGLRLGRNPRVVVTTTPRPSDLIRELLGEPTTHAIRGSTHDNRDHLAPTFFEKIIAKYEGTRLGQQEIYAEILEISEGAWFACFDPNKHIKQGNLAEYRYGEPVYLGIDAGTSRTTGAVWFQVLPIDTYRNRVTVFGEYLQVDAFSEANARAIKRVGEELPCRGRIDAIRIDPASAARSSLGPAAYGEYERVFGSRLLARSPGHIVVDGLDQIELLLETDCLWIHPRCVHLKAAFQNYVRAKRGGEFLNQPAIEQSPHEDMMDSLRYGIRDRFPEGREAATNLRRTPAGLAV